MTGDNSLIIERVTRRFGGVSALSDVSLTASPGECLGIIGGNGAGKTTLLNCISGIVPLTSGEIRLGATVLNGLRPDQIARLGVGRTFQLAEHFQQMRAWEFVTLGAVATTRASALACGLSLPAARRREADLREAAVRALLEQGIETWNRALSELPYGTQKAIDIIRVFLTNPRVALLDEPTSGTGESERDMIRRVISTRRQERGEAITVIIDHDVDFISSICDDLLVLEWGAVIATGQPSEVLGQDKVQHIYAGKRFASREE